MSSPRTHGFTLIELLVVISIIGLLSTVVLAALNSARGKATVAAGLKYSTYVARTQSDRAAGIWLFTETLGTTLADTSGNNNNGTLQGTGAGAWSAEVMSPLKSQSYKFPSDNATQYFQVLHSDTLKITSSTIAPSGVSFMAWVKPDAPGTARFIFSKGQYLFAQIKSDNTLAARLGGNAMSDTSRIIPDGTWTHIAIVQGRESLTESSSFSIYVNGENIKLASPLSSQDISDTHATDANDIGGGLTPPLNSLKIGATRTGASPFRGHIDEVYFFSRALGVAEIQKHYAESLPKFIALEL